MWFALGALFWGGEDDKGSSYLSPPCHSSAVAGEGRKEFKAKCGKINFKTQGERKGGGVQGLHSPLHLVGSPYWPGGFRRVFETTKCPLF